MRCSICFNEIPKIGNWDSGNNAYPINYGRCCSDCDNMIVIPARITILQSVPPEEFEDMQLDQLRNIQRQLELAKDDT